MNQRSTSIARMAVFGSYLFLVLAAVTTTVSAATAHGRGEVVIHGDKIMPHWFAGLDGVTNQFWYDLDQSNDRHEFILVDAVAGLVRLLPLVLRYRRCLRHVPLRQKERMRSPSEQCLPQWSLL